jgi:hypothetical protein
MGGPPVDNAETSNDVSGDRDAFELPVTVELDPTDTLQKLGIRFSSQVGALTGSVPVWGLLSCSLGLEAECLCIEELALMKKHHELHCKDILSGSMRDFHAKFSSMVRDLKVHMMKFVEQTDRKTV